MPPPLLLVSARDVLPREVEVSGSSPVEETLVVVGAVVPDASAVELVVLPWVVSEPATIASGPHPASATNSPTPRTPNRAKLT